MNERIKELAEQAQINGSIIYFYSPEFVQRFAELIIQECIELNRQDLAFNAFERLLNKYNEHFGVK